MMKISALNEESSEESDEENNIPKITKEAQEQIALTEYNKALQLLKAEKIEDALNILKDLLETELLDQVEKPEVPDGRTRPMLSLKYCCYKNIGGIYARLKSYDSAIDNYWEATNLDDTDVMLWYRMGSLAMETGNLEFACSTFKQGLKCNPNHWPCLDSIITAMFAVPDYTNCLLYISMALERDPSYVKGLAFRDKIFKDIPFFQESYKLFNPDWQLDPPLDTEYDRCLGEKLLNEAKQVAERWIEACRPDFEFKPLPDVSLKKPLEKFTWLELGESLIEMHHYITDNNLNFASKLNLNVDVPRDLEREEPGLSEQTENDRMEETEVIHKEEPIPEILSSPSIEIDCEIDLKEMNGKKINKLNDQQLPQVTTEMEVNLEDKSNPSSDVLIIEDGKSIKLDLPEIKTEVDEKMEDFTETINISNDTDVTLRQENSSEIIPVSSEEPKILDEVDKVEKNPRNEKSEQAEAKEEQQKVKKRRRSSLCFLQQWAWSSSSMRRSPRVRGSNRREPERDDVELEETMRRIFPSNLLPDTAKIIRDDPLKSMDDSMDTMDLYQLFASRETTNTDGIKSSESSKSPSPLDESMKYFGSEMETSDIQDFIAQYSGKNNLMVIIGMFTEFLSTKWDQEWPEELPDVYIKTYLFTREHIPHSSPISDPEENESILKHDAEMTLLFAEFHTDKWLNNRPALVPSASVDRFGTGIPSEELGYIIFASVRDDVLSGKPMIFHLRLLWVQVNLFMCQGDTEVSMRTLERMIYDLQQSDSTMISVKLPNCKYYSKIALPIVQKRLTSIERGKKLGEVQRLYDEQKYSELALILQETFKYAKQRNEVMTGLKLNVERVKQLSMLLDCLWQLEQYEECFIWAEACLNEAWQVYINSGEESERKKWAQSVLNSLEKLEACAEISGTFVIKYLDAKSSRLVQNLIQITCHQLDVPENSMEMPLETVTPWILLHHVLQHEEDKERGKSRQPQKSRPSDFHDTDTEDEDKDIPSPLMILFTGHEFLGRHAWCCMNEAKLLLFTLKTVIPRLCGPRLAVLREKIDKYLEQIFWCLYGHPNRTNKIKPKHLEDHQVPMIPLTWDIAQLLFEFYRPEVIPEFDSAKPMSISADIHHLFKKISTLVPKESDPSDLVEEMMNYIAGEHDRRPTVTKSLPYQVNALYYLLADHLFKNSNFSSAVKYYAMDVIIHPGAFNSWIALAMSVGTVMGTFLNNCKPILDINKLLFQAKMAQCSFERAVELKPGHSVMWIEYGNFVYMVHSFCSRLLKQESDTLSMEKFAILESRKETTLEAADNCFQSANRIYLANIEDEPHQQDERWLYHYMLGKIAEKRNEDPPVFLEHYERASDLLYKNNAHYPKRISLKNANNSAVEALEVHYRIHASILKYLEQHEGKPLKKSLGQLFLKCLVECASGPFMQYPSKLNRRRKEDINEERILREETHPSEVIPKNRTQDKRQNSVEEVAVPEKIEGKGREIKSDNKKRKRDNGCEESTKRMKVGNISHLQLMQDVLSIIDDLITKVCDNNLQRPKDTQKDSSDEVMVISSDESDRERHAPEKFVNKFIPVNAQDMMDDLMKQMLEEQPSQTDEEESRKSEGKWMQHEEVAHQGSDIARDKQINKEKHAERKKTQVNAVKEEATMSRRGSQESTTTTLTTTTNETNNSSFSSSDESSSSEDSSESDSSSVDSDSDSADSESDKKKRIVEEKEEYLTDIEVAKIISYCLAGLEQCVLRFPGHYKSIYRLSHFYFNNKSAKDNNKCRDLLLGTFKCQYHTGMTIQGLFADRKSTNFFNGVWRIPTDEIDRPGSFPSHMSRCVTLLMQVLKETDDSRMLMELCIQLRKIPDADKKYVRDSEREQLSRQALTLSLQSLRTRVQLMSPPPGADNTQLYRIDSRTHVLLDVYKIYQQVQKNFQGKEVQAFATLLVDTYKCYMGIKTSEGNLLEAAVRCCQQQKLANKPHLHQHRSEAPLGPLGHPAVVSLPNQPLNCPNQAPPVPTSPQTTQQRKPYKSSGTGRPRGRPPNVNKFLSMQASNVLNQFNAKMGFAGNMSGTTSQPLMNPFFVNPLMDQNMVSAMLATGLGGNMMDPYSAVNYLKNYQDILRQYQSNLSSIGGLAGFSNLPISHSSSSGTLPMMNSTINTTSSMPQAGMPGLGSMNNMGSLTVQQLLNMQNSTASTTSGMISTPKDHSHSVSITPVAHSKKSKHLHDIAPLGKMQKPLTSPTQVSLLKPSVLQSPKTTPPKQMSAPQIRVSKSLTEPQPAHNASLLNPIKSASPSGINLPVSHASLQASGLNIKPVSMGMQRGTSLQHKLLSKKQGQPLAQKPQHNPHQNPHKKQKVKPQMAGVHPGHYERFMEMAGSPFRPCELSGISVSPVSQTVASKIPLKPTFRKSGKSKGVDMTGGSIPGTSTAETYSVLNQLQQQSHLEIIPQGKHSKNIDFGKNLPLPLGGIPQKEARPAGTESMAVYEVPRRAGNPAKKTEKSLKDNVEIITLDD
ncbi:calcineurin-binding protein cabin-1 [Fopius arisanus]|uniref:Calcineurin-binding protein cabin-1 n=2 Tax=Fopius arisanus TaxID=64838 RepID=A0A9R1TG46_9HYME|nr:PREDICTED: calcineurin-binding protein cabin-1-like [Fopius arisanus]